MSAIDPRELRYAAISAFGLIIFTTLLKWTGVGQTRFKPLKPNTSNTTAAVNQSNLDAVMDPSLSTSNPFAVFIDMALTPLQLFIDLLLTWSSVWDSMGFTSIFILVPMTIMLVVVASGVYALIQVALP